MASIYPFASSVLKISDGVKNQSGKKFLNSNCIDHEIKTVSCHSNALYGSNKPAYEGEFKGECSNIWNNSTKRKSIVYKDDPRTKVVSGLGNIGFEDRLLNKNINYHINSVNKEKNFNGNNYI